MIIIPASTNVSTDGIIVAEANQPALFSIDGGVTWLPPDIQGAYYRTFNNLSSALYDIGVKYTQSGCIKFTKVYLPVA